MANRHLLGKNLRIKLDDNTLLHATECNFTSSLNLEAIATKDTDGEEQSPGSYTWGISTSTLVTVRDTGTQNDTYGILEKFQAKQLVPVEFTTDDANDIIITGNVYLTQCDIAAPVNGSATFSITGVGSGNFTLARVSS